MTYVNKNKMNFLFISYVNFGDTFKRHHLR